MEIASYLLAWPCFEFCFELSLVAIHQPVLLNMFLDDCTQKSFRSFLDFFPLYSFTRRSNSTPKLSLSIASRRQVHPLEQARSPQRARSTICCAPFPPLGLIPDQAITWVTMMVFLRCCPPVRVPFGVLVVVYSFAPTDNNSCVFVVLLSSYIVLA